MDKDKLFKIFVEEPHKRALIDAATASVFSFSYVFGISEEEALNILNIAIKANLEEKRDLNKQAINDFKDILKKKLYEQ